jgi:hypothetical protein
MPFSIFVIKVMDVFAKLIISYIAEGDMTLSKMTLSIMTLGIMTHSMISLSL